MEGQPLCGWASLGYQDELAPTGKWGLGEPGEHL